MYERREGPPLPSVCGNVQGPDRRPLGSLPQVDAERSSPTHLRRDGLCSLRLPADGEALHAPHHDQDVEHSGRP